MKTLLLALLSFAALSSVACSTPMAPTPGAVSLTLHLIDAVNANPVTRATIQARTADDGAVLGTFAAPAGTVRIDLPADRVVWLSVSAPGYIGGSEPARVTEPTTKTLRLSRE